MAQKQGITFFETQFRRQVASHEFALNPFETAALPFLRGRVLDLGSGLGNLAVEAARSGLEVVAVDASATAVTRLREVSSTEGLRLTAVLADLEQQDVEGDFDTIVAIGLLMFFPRDRALELLGQIQARVRPRGVAIVNVLVEGTTFLGMFEPDGYYLFGIDELEARFTGWRTLLSRRDQFEAPGGTSKRFSTIVVEKPED